MVERHDTEVRKAKRVRRGRAAEKRIQAMLDTLPMTQFKVFNDVPARYGNIDHLVISREGAVFLIETKGHRGKVSIEGERLLINGKPSAKNFIGQVNRNIQWLRNKIQSEIGRKAWIIAILVFVNASVGKRKTLKRVNIIESRDLRRLIERYRVKVPQRLIWNRRDRIADMLRANQREPAASVSSEQARERKSSNWYCNAVSILRKKCFFQGFCMSTG